MSITVVLNEILFHVDSLVGIVNNSGHALINVSHRFGCINCIGGICNSRPKSIAKSLLSVYCFLFFTTAFNCREYVFILSTSINDYFFLSISKNIYLYHKPLIE
jgi:hypothetical protein